jgi:quercetin dioxygenase-like cupin family protein
MGKEGGIGVERGTRRPKIVDKPWGREVWYAHTDRYAGKVLEVDEGHLLSLQKHRVKHETLYLQSGRMRFTLGDRTFEWTPGEAVEIPPDTVHRMEALEDSVILEVSTPELDDVVRLEDRYGRG